MERYINTLLTKGIKIYLHSKHSTIAHATKFYCKSGSFYRFIKKSLVHWSNFSSLTNFSNLRLKSSGGFALLDAIFTIALVSLIALVTTAALLRQINTFSSGEKRFLGAAIETDWRSNFINLNQCSTKVVSEDINLISCDKSSFLVNTSQ